jgi:hypothetical protein
MHYMEFEMGTTQLFYTQMRIGANVIGSQNTRFHLNVDMYNFSEPQKFLCSLQNIRIIEVHVNIVKGGMQPNSSAFSISPTPVLESSLIPKLYFLKLCMLYVIQD